MAPELLPVYTKIDVSKLAWILYLTFMACNAAYAGILNLQSSMNVEEGLGTTSVFIIFITSAVSCFCFIPFLMNYLGAKKTLILGELGFVIYMAGNFFPTWGVLTTVSVIHGILESAPWAASSVFVAYFGEQFWIASQNANRKHQSRTSEFYVQRGFGRFYSGVAFGQVLSNAVVSLVLVSLDKLKTHSQHNNVTTDSPEFPVNNSRSNIIIDDRNAELKFCGANDCQQDYIYNSTDGDLEKFQPSATATYVLLAMFMSISLISIIIQACYLPNPPTSSKAQAIEEISVTSEDDEKPRKAELAGVRQHFSEILRHVVSPLHLLAMTTFFYYGTTYGYNVTEYTRAFVSCTLGVEQVGTAIIVLGLFGGVFSAVFSFVLPRMGINRFLIVVFATHLSTYLLSLFWVPTSSNLWVVYVLAAMLGITEVSITIVSEGATAAFFRNNLGIAFSIKNLVTNLGIAANGAWSTSLCVYSKLYLQLALLALALTTMLGAQIYFLSLERKKERR